MINDQELMSMNALFDNPPIVMVAATPPKLSAELIAALVKYGYRLSLVENWTEERAFTALAAAQKRLRRDTNAGKVRAQNQGMPSEGRTLSAMQLTARVKAATELERALCGNATDAELDCLCCDAVVLLLAAEKRDLLPLLVATLRANPSWGGQE